MLRIINQAIGVKKIRNTYRMTKYDMQEGKTVELTV